MKILVLHGPNLNLLGTREPDIYGHTTMAEIDARLRGEAKDAELECRHSNHEGQLVDWLQAARDEGFDGVLFNFGALTHSSLVLADTLRAVALPAVEVHVSNIHGREPFREKSYTAAAAIGVITGFGPASYSLGLRALMDYLNARSA